MNFYQQGDVLMQQIKFLPANATVKQVGGSIVLALGEVTGHSHTIEEAEGVTLYTLDEILYVVADHEVTMVHQEHGAVTLPAGTYRVGIVQEYDYVTEEGRRVRD